MPDQAMQFSPSISSILFGFGFYNNFMTIMYCRSALCFSNKTYLLSPRPIFSVLMASLSATKEPAQVETVADLLKPEYSNLKVWWKKTGYSEVERRIRETVSYTILVKQYYTTSFHVFLAGCIQTSCRRRSSSCLVSP